MTQEQAAELIKVLKQISFTLDTVAQSMLMPMDDSIMFIPDDDLQ